MDSIKAFMRGETARVAKSPQKIFDWHKAARLIKDSGAKNASAGLESDWDWTGGSILQDGKPVPADDTYTYLSSCWATPELDLDGNVQACYVDQDNNPEGWDEHTYWPESALAILNS